MDFAGVFEDPGEELGGMGRNAVVRLAK